MGVKGVYVEGFLKNNGEFGELRSFLIAKLLQNPTMTIEEYHALMAEFCNGYYGAAGPYVMSYINTVKAAMTGDVTMAATVTENNIGFSSGLVSACEGYWNSAESAVSGNATLLTRVQKSRLHWTFAMYVNYNGGFTSSQYYALAHKMDALNVCCVNEVSAVNITLPAYDKHYYDNPRDWRTGYFYADEFD